MLIDFEICAHPGCSLLEGSLAQKAWRRGQSGLKWCVRINDPWEKKGSFYMTCCFFRCALNRAWLLLLTLTLLIVIDGGKSPIQASSAIDLAPHRAVYEMTLDEVRPGSSVSSIIGYMVFKFSGSACSGFALDMSLVNSITNLSGETAVVDVRAESFEDANGKAFRFNSSQYQNYQLVDKTSGNAARRPSGGGLSVRLEKEEGDELTFSGDILFPTQHSLLLLRAAHKGKSLVYADVYDGSEKGDRFYSTTSFIGKNMSPGADADLPAVENAEQLLELQSWPVAISYFDADKKGDQVPSYELSFRLYGNGVSRQLILDYGDYVMRGVLKDIEFLDSPPCGPE